MCWTSSCDRSTDVPVSRHTRDQTLTDTNHTERADMGTDTDLLDQPDWPDRNGEGSTLLPGQDLEYGSGQVGNRPARVPTWTEEFLTLLAGGHTVAGAARRVKIRTHTAQARRRKDPAFAAAWNEATRLGTVLMEREAERRAYYGTLKGVYYKGVRCGVERTYSDTLMIFLLKARRPDKYRERYDDGARQPVQINVNVETVTGTTQPVTLVTQGPALPLPNTDPVPPVQATDECTPPINPPVV